MADRVITWGVQAGAAVMAVVLVSASTALADGPDPTRPADVAETATGAAAAAPTGLQAVLLRPHGKSVAVINGQTVAVGERVGEGRLVSLGANQAVLVGPNGREVLKLAPAAEKKPSAAASPAARTKKRISGRGESHE